MNAAAVPFRIHGLDHVVLRARDQDALVRFYCDVLGCRVEKRQDAIGLVQLRAGVSLIDIRLSQMEPTDLRGIPFRSGQLVEWSIPSVLPDAERHGPSGILFLDEITSAPPSVSAAAYQLILDRRLGEYKVPDGWVIFAAGNRQGDRGVTYAMPAPLASL